MRDRGNLFIPTVLLGLALTAAVLAAMTPWMADEIARHRAQHAADAAALAGVDGGRDASNRLAAANGAVVVAWQRVGDEVTVVVEVHGQTARARATNGP